ncbi:MAG: cyclic nucleotide-binding domain-containing protein [Bdellovibrionaceae bacterium]|nr:cyclic nucleotide-binding domain-containing protein [Pseudobdellovibrionaceae bacterium]
MNFQWDNLFRSSAREQKLISKLRENMLFKDLSTRELRLVENIVNIRTYRPGEVVFRQGDAGVGMYIISKGMVNIYTEAVDAATTEVSTSQVTSLREGDFFGDLALVDPGNRRSASAVAGEETTLIGFFKPDLIEIADRNPTAGVKILLRLGEVLGVRLRETTLKISELKKDLPA